MRLILNAFNLIGDSTYLVEPLRRYLSLHGKDVDCVVVHPGLAYEMFARVLPKDTVIVGDEEQATSLFPDATMLGLGAGQAAEIAFVPALAEGNNARHISQAYGALLGLNIETPVVNIDWQQIKEELPRTIYAISPFSRSCSIHTDGVANKTLADSKWEYIIRYLRRQGGDVRVIAGPHDRLKKCSVPLDAYFTAGSLLELEQFLKSCKLLISVDNGLGHIASALHTPMISLWPKVSNVDFIYPRFSQHTTAIYMDPNETTPAQLLFGIRHIARHLLNGVQSYEEILSEG